jgi:hypothetical protein
LPTPAVPETASFHPLQLRHLSADVATAHNHGYKEPDLRTLAGEFPQRLRKPCTSPLCGPRIRPCKNISGPRISKLHPSCPLRRLDAGQSLRGLPLHFLRGRGLAHEDNPLH